jgi:hypothetical protein
MHHKPENTVSMQAVLIVRNMEAKHKTPKVGDIGSNAPSDKRVGRGIFVQNKMAD